MKHHGLFSKRKHEKKAHDSIAEDSKEKKENDNKDCEQHTPQEAQDEQVEIEDIDPGCDSQIETYLRDSLIKSFMVIFTNKSS